MLEDIVVTTLAVILILVLLIVLVGAVVGIIQGCAEMDTINTDYNYAIAQLQDGSIVEGKVSSYNITTNKTIVVIDNISYCVNSEDITLMTK